MKETAFQELFTSIRQAGQIRRGKLKPARVSTFRPADVKGVREKLKTSQAEFALMIGVSVATLRNWEQGRRTPDAPALALLRVAARNPRAVAEALHREPRKNEFGIILDKATQCVAVAEFDALLARMQTAKAKKGMAAAFNATSDQLGRAAVKAARRNH